MMVNLICFIIGGLCGVVTMAVAVVAGDADRCEDCCRMREELEREHE